MALDTDDDLTLADGASGTFIAATDYVSSKHYPYCKLTWGADGTVNIIDTATGKPLPVQLRSSTGTDLIGTAGTASAAVLTVQGTASGTPQPITAASGALASGSVVSGAIVDGAMVTLGSKADAKSTATDTTSISAISIWKQISASIQTVAGSVVSLGQAVMASSQPIVIASDQSPIRTKSGGSEYETVAVSQTDQALGATGAAGDYIEALLCVVATAATSEVKIKDGAGSAITILPNNVGAGVGTYPVPLGLISLSGAWKVTTAAGVSVIATGDFT